MDSVRLKVLKEPAGSNCGSQNDFTNKMLKNSEEEPGEDPGEQQRREPQKRNTEGRVRVGPLWRYALYTVPLIFYTAGDLRGSAIPLHLRGSLIGGLLSGFRPDSLLDQ